MSTFKDGMFRQHNHCFDFLKGIARVCVVFMHCEFPGVLGTVIQTISRFSVPFFFMLSSTFLCFFAGTSSSRLRLSVPSGVLQPFRVL